MASLKRSSMLIFAILSQEKLDERLEAICSFYVEVVRLPACPAGASSSFSRNGGRMSRPMSKG